MYIPYLRVGAMYTTNVYTYIHYIYHGTTISGIEFLIIYLLAVTPDLRNDAVLEATYLRRLPIPYALGAGV